MKSESEEGLFRANTLLGLQFLSDFGDQITATLLALYLLEITQSTSQVGMVYFFATCGFLVFTLAGGLLGDKISRRNVLVFSDLGRGILVLALILAFLQKSIGLVYVISFLVSMLGALQRPAKLGIWAESIPERKLEPYNSLSELSIQLSVVVGPLIAAYFDQKNIENMGFAIDATTFFLCAFAFNLLFRRTKYTKALANSSRCKSDLLQGFKIIAKRLDMSQMVLYDAIQMIGFGAFNATFLILAQRDFGWTKAQYSYHLSIIAAFTVVGAILGSTKYVVRMNQTVKLVSCAIVSAVALMVMLELRSFPTCSLLFGLCDGLAVFTMAVTRTRVQLAARKDYPDDMTSIIAARAIVIKLATLLGTASCLLVEDYISLEATLLIFTLPIGLSCIPVLWKARTPRPMVAASGSTEGV